MKRVQRRRSQATLSDLLGRGDIMLLKNFIEDLQRIYDESKGTHHYGGNVTVDFILEDPSGEIDVDIELVPDSPDYSDMGVEANTMMGCGCWIGANIRLRVIRAP